MKPFPSSFPPVALFVFFLLSLGLSHPSMGQEGGQAATQAQSLREAASTRIKLFSDPNIKTERDSLFLARMNAVNFEQMRLTSEKCSQQQGASSQTGQSFYTSCFCANQKEMYNFQIMRYTIINDFVTQKPYLKGSFFIVAEQDNPSNRMLISPEEQQPPLPFDKLLKELKCPKSSPATSQ